MPTSAKIIKDSTNWLNKRLTTWVLEYPRYIHSEMLTHRVFSKNSASSRAIPYSKMVQNIRDNMVMPIWTENKKGMQGKVITFQSEILNLNGYWEEGFRISLVTTEALNSLGVHKQNVNRILEPWMHIKVILTGTDFDNWFALRAHKDAQPEIQELAYLMQAEYEKSVPTLLQPGDWHIPFGEESQDILDLASKEFDEVAIGDLDVDPDFNYFIDENILRSRLKTSVARCARISYNNVDGSSSTVEKDIELFDKLIVSEPLHASPAEHQAQVPTLGEIRDGYYNTNWRWSSETTPHWFYDRGKYVSNLVGYKQLRKVIEVNEF